MDILFKKTEISSDGALIIGVYEDILFSKTGKKIDAMLGGRLGKALKIDNFNGRLGETFDFIALGTLPVKRLLCVGLGKKEEMTDLRARKIGACAANSLLCSGETSVAFAVDDLSPVNVGFGAKIASYRFTKHKTFIKKPATVTEFYILTEKAQSAQNQYEPMFAVGKGIHTARDLVNEPANVMTPQAFAKRAEELQKYGLQTEVYDKTQMKAKGMNMILGVAQGSANSPLLVVTQWRGCPEDKNTHVVIVGKGVTFDSGGISLKHADGMEDMKEDLAGAATALGTLQALAMRKAKVNAAAVMVMVENMPSGTAIRPGDVLKSLAGKTVEVISTDAEGRLILGDALWYAQERFSAPYLIDLASLTGSIVTGLGFEYAGLFSNDADLSDKLLKASLTSGERLWPMPLDDFYSDLIVSDVADIKNSSSTGRNGGAITAAAFLKQFVMPNVKWAHFDIAGTALRQKASDFCPKGGSGYGVILLNDFIKDFLEKKSAK